MEFFLGDISLMFMGSVLVVSARSLSRVFLFLDKMAGCALCVCGSEREQ